MQARLKQAGTAFARRPDGRLLSRPSRLDGESVYLLSGFPSCKRCGGALGGITRLHGRGPAANRRRHTLYGCAYHVNRGPTVCNNDVMVATETVDRALLAGLCKVVSTDMVEDAIDRALARLLATQDERRARQASVEHALADVERRIGRLVDVIAATGGPIESLVAKLKAEEDQRKTLRAEFDQIAATSRVVSLDAERVKRDVRALAGDVATLLVAQRTPQTRQMLRKVLVGKIVGEPFEEEGRRGYRLSGAVTFAPFLRGEVFEPVRVGEQSDGGGPNGIRTVFEP